jgi:hypothetical protein
MRFFWVVLCAALGVTPCLAEPDLTAASATADQFLSGISSCDVAERRRLLEGIVWQTSTIDHSALADPTTLSDGGFATDSDGVSGYERLVRVSIRVSRGAQFSKTFRLVAYADRRSQKWKIWSFEEGDDAEGRLAFWRDQVRRASPVEETSATVRYADSLGASGRLNEALDLYLDLLEGDRWDEGVIVRTRLNEAVSNLRRIIAR